MIAVRRSAQIRPSQIGKGTVTMARPPRERVVLRLPRASLLKPAGIPARELERVDLTIDEVEALRLVDLDGLSHEEAAGSLGVSRQTVGRVLEGARRKVADALVNGKAVVIGGGAYQIAGVRCCAACGARWQRDEGEARIAGDEQMRTSGRVTPDEVCPRCGSRAVRACVGPGGGRGRHCATASGREPGGRGVETGQCSSAAWTAGQERPRTGSDAAWREVFTRCVFADDDDDGQQMP